jgi:hypothetical protein
MAKPRSVNSLCLGSNLFLIGKACYHTQKSLRMSAEYSSFAGWEKNLKLSNSFAEVIVTLDVGPRIISYRPAKGRSVFKLVNDQVGKSGEEEWKIRGGHRLWTAPEDFGQDDSLCYALDNSEVEHAIRDDFTVRVSNLIVKPVRIRREMIITLAEASPKVTVEHRIVHEAGDSLEVAPWGLSVMAPGGYALLSHPRLGSHPADYLPNRVMVVWPFTDLSDRRFRVGRRTLRLSQSQGDPFKIGLRHPEGWAAYVFGDHLFIKTVPLIEGATYPDMGSNFETFTNSEFLELETLGPLKRISAGETLVHTESWVVFAGVSLPDPEDEEALLKALEPYRAKLSEA